eukprot:scaffold91780_cov34-Phaeocystis_antarctica.AAC.1
MYDLLRSRLGIPWSCGYDPWQTATCSQVAAAVSTALNITVDSHPAPTVAILDGKCQGWHVKKHQIWTASSVYDWTPTDCQDLCSQSAICGATSFSPYPYSCAARRPPHAPPLRHPPAAH